jgi:iron(III) transport system permease protein
LIEAGELMRSDMQVFARIILPLSAPPIIAGAGLLFLLSITDYSVPSLFSVNVYSLEIFAEYSASNQPSRAVLLALPLLLVTIIVVVMSQAALRNTAQSSARHIRNWMPPSWPSWFNWLQKFGMTILLIQISVLIFGLVATVGSWDNLISSVNLARSEISFTFWIAIATALICIPFSIAAAVELKRSGVLGRFWWLLVTIPMAIPAPLIGIGLIGFWSQSMMPGIYGSSAMPVLAMLARFIPLAAILLLFQFRFIDPLLIDAARIFQTNQMQTWAKIWLPLMIPGILAAAGIAFALTIGELGATLIVAPPGQATLSMRIYNYLHYGASSNVAGLCLMMAIVTLIMGCLAVVVLSGCTYLSRSKGSDISEK